MKIKPVEMKPGWIERGFKRAREDMKTWPKWMLREAKNWELLELSKTRTGERK